MNKITPQQAFEASKLLHPSTTHVGRAGDTGWYAAGPSALAEVDWPEGMTQWPMPEPQWRDARMPDDYGKEAMFRDVGEVELWYGDGRKLCGYVEDIVASWVDSKGAMWRFCQVRDDALVATEEIDHREGWRGVRPGELYREGDEYLSHGQWLPRTTWGSVCEAWHVPNRRRFRPYSLNELASFLDRETSHGYIEGISKEEITFKKNDIVETRAFGDCEGITWADGSVFGVDG